METDFWGSIEKYIEYCLNVLLQKPANQNYSIFGLSISDGGFSLRSTALKFKASGPANPGQADRWSSTSSFSRFRAEPMHCKYKNWWKCFLNHQWAMAAIVSLSRTYFIRLFIFIGIRAAWRPLLISLVHWLLCLICKYHNVWLQQKSVNHCVVSMFLLFYSWGWFPGAHIVTKDILL